MVKLFRQKPAHRRVDVIRNQPAGAYKANTSRLQLVPRNSTNALAKLTEHSRRAGLAMEPPMLHKYVNHSRSTTLLSGRAILYTCPYNIGMAICTHGTLLLRTAAKHATCAMLFQNVTFSCAKHCHRRLRTVRTVRTERNPGASTLCCCSCFPLK